MGGEVSLKLPFILGYVDDETTHISNNDDSGQKTNETKSIQQESTNRNEDEDGTANANSATTKTTDSVITTATNQKDKTSSSPEQHRTTNDTFDDIVTAQLAGPLMEKIQFTDDTGSQNVDSVEDNEKSLNLVTAQIHHQLSEQSNEEIAHET